MWQNPTGKTVAVERGIKPSGVERGEARLGWKVCLVAWTWQGHPGRVTTSGQQQEVILNYTSDKETNEP